jgi:allantoin racemase
MRAQGGITVKRITVTYPVPVEIISPGFEVDIAYPMNQGVYGAPYSAVDYKIVELGSLEAGLRAQESGADAFFMNSGGDYGIADLRDNLRIPVVGGMQASMLVAANLGQRFSIVTIWPQEVNHIHHRQLSLYGMESRCVSIRNTARFQEVNSEVRHRTMVDHMQSGAEEILARILAEIELAAEVDGADSIVLGCTCMHPIAAQLAARVSIPVIDGTTAGYRMTELIVTLGLRPKSPAEGSKLVERGLLQPTLAAACASTSSPDACTDGCDVLEPAGPRPGTQGSSGLATAVTSR